LSAQNEDYNGRGPGDMARKHQRKSGKQLRMAQPPPPHRRQTYRASLMPSFISMKALPKAIPGSATKSRGTKDLRRQSPRQTSAVQAQSIQKARNGKRIADSQAHESCADDKR
jgi:hypothetical protein